MQNGAIEADLGWEWLLSSGNGGYASGRSQGPRSRSYHGLFIAALPAPLDRMLVLAQVDEAVVLSSHETLLLASHLYEGNHRHPEGFRHMEELRHDAEGLVWRWREGDFILERKLVLGPGNRGRLSWSCLGAAVERIALRPYVAFRSHHGGDSPKMETELSTDLQTARIDFLGKGEAFQMKASCGSFQLSPRTQERIWLKDEELRGLKAVESLDSPLELIWHEPQSGDSLHLDFELVPDSLQKRRRPEPVQSEGLLGRLSKAMLDFLIFQPADDRPGLIAGYPWFNEWGRDTMIALPGLSVALGHDDMAMEILMAWASRCRGGLLPNRLAEDSGEVAYNSVDAPLWYWRSLIRLTRKAGAFSAMPEVLQKAATEILSAFHEGTDHGIHVDPRDGLLVSGTFNSHLTWMDAFVAGKAISPRHGKCVELQALYLEALVAAQELGLAPDLNKHWRERAKRLAQSFRGRFLGAAHGSLEDCVDGDESRLRPNQLVALGSAVVPLSSHERSTCFQSLSKELWTPRGPRSLAPTDPLYESHYGGGALKRDRAYHQGTVWAWLTGPYVDASMQAEAGSLAELRRRNEERVASVLKDLDCGLRGQISEIFAASAPHEACGAPAQAWSVAEIIRVIADYNLDPQRISELMQVPD